MDLTRREFTRSVAAVAALTAAGPAAALLPEPRIRMVSLEPARLAVPGPIYLKDEVKVLARFGKHFPKDAGTEWVNGAAAYVLKPFPREFEVEHLDVFFMVREFTEEQRPGTGGGCEALVLKAAPVPQVGVWKGVDVPTKIQSAARLSPMSDGNLCAMFDVRNLVDCKVPDYPLWVRAQGTIPAFTPDLA